MPFVALTRVFSMLKARSDDIPSAHSSVQKESSQATRSSVTHHDVMYLLQWHATRSQLPTDAPTGALISLIQFSKNESDVVRPQAASRFVDSYSVYAFNPRLTWWSRWGSNPRPQACKARALPTELRPRGSGLLYIAIFVSYCKRWRSLFSDLSARVVGLERLELSTPRLSSVCSNQLSYRPEPVQLGVTPFDFSLKHQLRCFVAPQRGAAM